MSEYEYDPGVDALRDAYDQDPLGVTTQLVAAAVSQAVAGTQQVAAQTNAAVYKSQAAIAAAQAAANLRSKYSDWDKQAPYTNAVLERNQYMIPHDDGILDPATLERAMEDAYRLGREDAADAYDDRRWAEIKAAPSNRLNFD